jgi:hypothetical protein
VSSWRPTPVPPGAFVRTGPQALRGAGLRFGELLDLDPADLPVLDHWVGAARHAPPNPGRASRPPPVTTHGRRLGATRLRVGLLAAVARALTGATCTKAR